MEVGVPRLRRRADCDGEPAVVRVRRDCHPCGNGSAVQPADRDHPERLAGEGIRRLVVGEHIDGLGLPSRRDHGIGRGGRQRSAGCDDIELDPAGLALAQCIAHTEDERRRAALDGIRVRLDGELLPGEGVAETGRQRREDGVGQLAQVLRVRIGGQLEQVEGLRLARLEVDHAAVERGRLVLPGVHRDGKHERRLATGRIRRSGAVSHLEGDRRWSEILGRRRVTESVVVQHEVRAVRVCSLHRARIGEFDFLAAHRDDIVVQIDGQGGFAAHLERRGLAVELGKGVVQPGNPDEGVGDNARIVRIGHGERDDLTLLLDPDVNLLASGHRRGCAVPGHDRHSQFARVAIREEYVLQDVDVDAVLAQDVGQSEHSVVGYRVGAGCLRIDGDRDEGRTRASVPVLDRVDEPVAPWCLRRRDLHDIVDDLRRHVSAVRSHRGHREHAAVRIGVVGENLHGNRAAGTHPHIVLRCDRVARAARLGTDADSNGSGRPRAQGINHGVGERVASRGVTARLIVHVFRPNSNDRALLWVGFLAEQLHRVAIRVDAGEGNRDAHRLPGEHPADHRRRHGRIVRGLHGLAHCYVHLCLSHLAIRARHLIDGGEVARPRRCQIAQHISRREQQPGVTAERRRELRFQGQFFAIRLHVIGEYRHGDDVADAGGHIVVIGDRWLQTRRSGDLHHRDHALGLRQAVADPIVEPHRPACQRRCQRHPDDALVKDFGAHPGVRCQVVQLRHQQHAPCRVDVRRRDIHGAGSQDVDKHVLGNCDRFGIGIGCRSHVDADDSIGCLGSVVHHIIDIVCPHLVAREPERPCLEARSDGQAGLRRHTGEP